MAFFYALPASVPESRPSRVGVVAKGAAEPITVVARALRARLDKHPGIQVAFFATALQPAPGADDETVSRASRLLVAAERHYLALNPHEALEAVDEVARLLGGRTDSKSAISLLAQALRIRGLTQLYLGQADAASSSLGTAAFLAPDYIPSQEQWPPQARLAYADAVARTRRGVPGSLSIRVVPDAAAVWFDGRFVGVGSTTIRDVQPGEHWLMSSCPGHGRFSALVSVQGEGRLSNTAVYLKPIAEKDPTQSLWEALAAATDGPTEVVVARQVAGLADIAASVVVGESGDGPAKQTMAWVLHGEQGRIGSAVALDNLDFAVHEIASRILGRARHRSTLDPAVVTARGDAPWYRSWLFWGALGGTVLAASAAVTYYAFRRQDTDRVTLVLGQ